MTILELAELFKTMIRPDSIVTLFDGLFLGKYKDSEVQFLHNLYFEGFITNFSSDLSAYTLFQF